MAEIEVVDPEYEAALSEAMDWLVGLAEQEREVLMMVTGWIEGICDDTQAVIAQHASDVHDDRFARNWKLSAARHRLESSLANFSDCPGQAKFRLRYLVVFFAQAHIVDDSAWSESFRRPFLSAKMFIKLSPEFPELTEFLEGVAGNWVGTPHDLNVVARQLLA